LHEALHAFGQSTIKLAELGIRRTLVER
jgi:hypothetical protein